MRGDDSCSNFLTNASDVALYPGSEVGRLLDAFSPSVELDSFELVEEQEDESS